MSLTLKKFHEENLARCKESFHDVDAWSECDYMTALCGEIGEAANFIKKLRRLQDDKCSELTLITADVLVEETGKELADALCYISLLAGRMGIDLEEVLIDKFDEVSARVNSSRTLRE